MSNRIIKTYCINCGCELIINEQNPNEECEDCSELEEKESNLMDKYRDVGMSPSDFM